MSGQDVLPVTGYAFYAFYALGFIYVDRPSWSVLAASCSHTLWRPDLIGWRALTKLATVAPCACYVNLYTSIFLSFPFLISEYNSHWGWGQAEICHTHILAILCHHNLCCRIAAFYAFYAFYAWWLKQGFYVFLYSSRSEWPLNLAGVWEEIEVPSWALDCLMPSLWLVKPYDCYETVTVTVMVTVTGVQCPCIPCNYR